jgi:hypothetical protein
MAAEQPELKDETFYSPLFEPITTKLRGTGKIDLEIFIGELFPMVGARYDGEDVYEAIMLLEEKGLIRRDDTGGDLFIELVERKRRAREKVGIRRDYEPRD